MRTNCTHCWNPINWCESFDMYGHGDGDDCIHTSDIQRALSAAGYAVDILDGTMHNPIVLRITQVGAAPGVVYSDTVPEGNNPGYSNPRTALPADIVALLDRTFGVGEFLG